MRQILSFLIISIDYSANEFGIDGKQTIRTLDLQYQKLIGSHNRLLSASDIARINTMYIVVINKVFIKNVMVKSNINM